MSGLAGPRSSPSCLRNREPILAVLREVLPSPCHVLEIASGTGQHGPYFVERLPGLTWQPSDRTADLFETIEAWRAPVAHAVRPPLLLDATSEVWPVTAPGAMFCANMIHIAPLEAARGLLRGAGRGLPAGASLVLYGPFKRGGEHTAPSNAAFDASLRARDPAWGIRDLEQVIDLAAEQGLSLDRIVSMPANNLTVVLRA